MFGSKILSGGLDNPGEFACDYSIALPVGKAASLVLYPDKS